MGAAKGIQASTSSTTVNRPLDSLNYDHNRDLISLGSDRRILIRQSSSKTNSRLVSAESRLYTPSTIIQQQLESRLKLALVPKNTSSTERNQIKIGTPSGIKSNRIHQRNKYIIPNQFQQLHAESLPTNKTLQHDSRKQERGQELISPQVKEKIRRESKILSDGTSNNEVLGKSSDIHSIVKGKIETRRKSLIPAAAKFEESKRERQVALDALRVATANTIIQVDEESLDLNGDGVSFSLSSRIKRQTLVLQESNAASQASSISGIQNEDRRRKFKDKSKLLLNTISVIHDLDGSGAAIKAGKKSNNTSHESLSNASNEGTQTASTYSANVLEESSTKKQTKIISAAVGTIKKAIPKSEPGIYTGIKSHSIFMRPPFPPPTKNEILFGPYEQALLEIQESLNIHHIFENLDYYYMPSNPIRRSFLESSKFAYALEPVYNDQHLATEVLKILPIKRNSD